MACSTLLPLSPVARFGSSSRHRSSGVAIRVSAVSIVRAPVVDLRCGMRKWRRPGSLGTPAEGSQDLPFDIARLEQYTEKVTNEVLRVHAVVDGEEDQVIIFKGFSSSLTRPTAYDPAEPVLPPSATVRAIDRIRGPFDPARVLLIKGGRGLSWEQFQALLEEKGL